MIQDYKKAYHRTRDKLKTANDRNEVLNDKLEKAQLNPWSLIRDQYYLLDAEVTPNEQYLIEKIQVMETEIAMLEKKLKVYNSRFGVEG